MLILVHSFVQINLQRVFKVSVLSTRTCFEPCTYAIAISLRQRLLNVWHSIEQRITESLRH